MLGRIHSGVAFYNKGLYHGGSHVIDLLVFYLGNAAWVSAAKRKDAGENKGDVAIDCFLGFENEAIVSLLYADATYYVLSEASS
jgi:predicted dehydrogenase